MNLIHRLITVMFICMSVPLLVSSNTLQAKQTDSIHVLVVFSSNEDQIDEYQRLLELQLAHFSENITFRHSSHVTKSDLSKTTHLVYQGTIDEEIPSNTVKLINSFTGPLLAIGHNIEQLSSYWKIDRDTIYLEEATISNVDDKQLTNRNVELFPFIKEDKKQQTLVKVKKNNNTYPLMVKRNNHFYLATTNLFSPVSHFLADALHFYFSVEHDHVNKAMLRLEDIHPKLIGEDLMEIATYLKNKDIPYLVSVIPVYKNPKTKEEFHLSDNSKLVDVLQFMQNNGGSFVLHGYTDQYGNNPTGDGFEFWDKQHNQPIYFPPNQLEIIKSEKDFADSTEYKKYLEDKKKFETEYIKERIKKGMAELEKVQLYPIAFEAPHYAMSQNGYQVISDYFPFYIGQVQLSDQDWRVMTESPTISNPNFLNGMTLFPETVRYIEYNEPNSLAQIREHITETSIVRDGVISGFYHPFLGKDQLTELVSEFEKQSHIEWIDLQEIYNDAFPNKIKFQQSSDNDKKKAPLNGDTFDSSQSKSALQSTNEVLEEQSVSLTFGDQLRLLKEELYWALFGIGLIVILTFASYRVRK